MNLPRRLFGCPIHPLLVHFPIALWIATPFLDLASLLATVEPWRMLSLAVTLIGVVFGALAMATGLLEYLEPSLAGIDMRLAARHGTRTTLAWCVFTGKLVVATLLPEGAQWSMGVCLILDLVGCWLLVQGVIFGTRQVYEQLEKQ